MELRKKALRRGEKLARTLRKMTAGDDRGSTPERVFLRELEQTLERIRKHSDRRRRTKPIKGQEASDLKFAGRAGERLLSSKSKSRTSKQPLASVGGR